MMALGHKLCADDQIMHAFFDFPEHIAQHYPA